MLQDSNSMVSDPVGYFDAGLLKRLAEAADCFRDDLYHYFVCKKTAPFDLYYTAGYYSDGDAADAADSLKVDNSLGSDYFKFGPYKTPDAGDSSLAYDSIQLRFMNGSNEVHCETLTNDIDAIVLSLSAYDKFLQPYYIRLYGIDAVQAFRPHVIDALTATPKIPVRHKGGRISPAGTGGTKAIAGNYELS